MIKNVKNKRGQVTIFIILGILIVFAIIGYFAIANRPSSEISPKENPQAYIEECLKNNVRESSEKIFALGGSLEANNFLLFNKTDIRFLCYTNQDKELCTTEDPTMKQTMENSIKQDTIKNVESCFKKLKESFSNYEYTEKELEYTVEIVPEAIKATAKKEITISRDGQTQKFNIFISEEYNPAYNFILITNEILRDEIDCACGKISCTSDLTLLTQTNLKFRLGLDITPRMEKVYTIQDRTTNQEFKFAVRNCII
jgi:hypothetical protein